MIEVLLLLVALALVLACGGFVAAEFAFLTVDRATVEREAEAGDRRAAGALVALRTLSTQLSGAQLGITITNLAIGFLAEPAIARLVDGPLESLGLSDTAARGVAVVVALVLATSVTMVFGELVPKNIALSLPLETARRIAGFQRGFTRATGPLLTALNGSANVLLRRLGVEPQEELASARSAQELASLVDRSAEQGTLALETADLLQRSIAFGERRADDVMTPRVRMRSLHPDDPVTDVVALARDSGFSRFPVLAEEGEEVHGVVHIRHAVGVPFERRDVARVREVMVDATVVPSTVELDPLLAQLREGGMQMAVVVDEFGGIDGLVTLEDLVEEIVGEVVDEHDDERPGWEAHPDGTFTLSGLLRPDEASEALGDVPVPEDEDYETLAGLVGLHLGRIPAEDDVVVVGSPDEERPRHRIELRVEAMDGLRVDRLRVRVEDVVRDDEDDDGEDHR